MSGATEEDLPEREWTTVRARQAEQFALWQEAVAQAFVPVTVTRPAEGPFHGGVTVRRLGSVDMANIASRTQTVHRTTEQVRSDAGDVYFLNLPLSSGSSATQDGRVARLAPGDFVIVDSTRPFELGFREDFRQISLKMPRELLQARLVAPEEATAVTVPGSRGVGAVAGAAITTAITTAASLDRSTARALSNRLADLLALALGGVRPAPALAPDSLLLQAAFDEVDRRLGDPELSPAVVADRVGISVRYLHRLFSQQGPTFGRWVLARRLEQAHHDLTDRDRAEWTISRVAHHRGFADPSYFARVFKARYGMTPRQIRALALGAAPLSR